MTAQLIYIVLSFYTHYITVLLSLAEDILMYRCWLPVTPANHFVARSVFTCVASLDTATTACDTSLDCWKIALQVLQMSIYVRPQRELKVALRANRFALSLSCPYCWPRMTDSLVYCTKTRFESKFTLWTWESGRRNECRERRVLNTPRAAAARSTFRLFPSYTGTLSMSSIIATCDVSAVKPSFWPFTNSEIKAVLWCYHQAICWLRHQHRLHLTLLRWKHGSTRNWLNHPHGKVCFRSLVTDSPKQKFTKKVVPANQHAQTNVSLSLWSQLKRKATTGWLMVAGLATMFTDSIRFEKGP